MAEKTLRLEQPDRQRLQVALTCDGMLGPRSREMISAWQRARNQPATGFLTATQQQLLLKEAAPAIAKFDEQRKTEEENARADRERARAPATTPVATAPSPTPSRFDGAYVGEFYVGTDGRRLLVKLSIANGRGAGTMTTPGCNPSTFSASMSPMGEIIGEVDLNCILAGPSQLTGLLTISGRPDGSSLLLDFWNNRGGIRALRLARQAN